MKTAVLYNPKAGKGIPAARVMSCLSAFFRGDELLVAGLEVPQITRVAMALRHRGVDIDPAVYTMEELHRQLLALGKGGGVC